MFFPVTDTGHVSKFQFALDYCQVTWLYRKPLAREIAQALPLLFTLNKLLTRHTRKRKKIRVLLTVVELKTFRLLVRSRSYN